MSEAESESRGETLLIDDFSSSEQSRLGTRWEFFSDQVMGGISTGTARHVSREGQTCLELSGEVSLENNGGFVQVALDLTDSGDCLDASAATGVAVTLAGDGRRYAVNLRSADTQRPWQSYRCAVESAAAWQTLHLPFTEFVAHRLDTPLDTTQLRRIGLIAIGEPGPVSVALARIAFYHEAGREA